MSDAIRPEDAESLVRQDLITREELSRAREQEARSGVPWYKWLVQQQKVTFEALENLLRYEFHSPSARSAHNSLGEALVRRNVISRDQLDEALAEQRRSGRLLGNILLEKGFVQPRDIALALAEQHGMTYAELADTPSDPAALDAVPAQLAEKNGLLPARLEDGGQVIVFLATQPQAQDRAHEVAMLLGKRARVLLTACDDLTGEIRRRYAAREQEEVPMSHSESPRSTPVTRPVTKDEGPERIPAVEDTPDRKPITASAADTARFAELGRAASGASVIKLVSTIIEGAVRAGATDIHLDPQQPETRVRFRIDGVLHDVMSIPEAQHAAVVSRVKVLADMDITETRHPQDGHFRAQVGDVDLDVRVATMPTFLGERVVLRLLDQSAVLSGVKDLGLEPDDEAKLLRNINQPYGMILVTGPTGSGKTTTLYAALNQKDVITESIVTLEDPVEYQLSGINQVQIDPDIDLTFAATLRAALRQDIDVLLVGEIRDQETAQIAIRAAMTGHLVFSTLHTNDAPEAISTLRNMGIPPFLISSALTCVVGQRLVRKICPECKKRFRPKPDLLAAIGLPEDTKTLYRGAGCSACHHTGCKGRTGIFEVLEITPAVRELILKEASPDKLAEAAGMKSMADRCRNKILDGMVAPEEFLRVIRV
ncbi:MAG TPA: ATPase, T2SS/T4P/T4SS family [Candidatus Hydrogenedentes bacterium]|nr:ATPase, T2SS/T4P/T4SS family [Candidatus Hydrogenedentota bacterium]